MSKKTKRQMRKDATAYFAPAKEETSSTGRSSNFNPDYSYILKDLGRIGTLAGSFIVILIVLSFFLH
jgi:hypothetical protein